jgi:hypothetical protein
MLHIQYRCRARKIKTSAPPSLLASKVTRLTSSLFQQDTHTEEVWVSPKHQP